jgi:hypothetical protein
MIQSDGAPMTTDVRDGGHPPERSISKRVSSFWRTIAGEGGALGDVRTCGEVLVEEEDFAEDLGWDAAGGGEAVAAGTDLAQCAKDGSHLCIDEVKRCRICEGRGRDLLEDIVDEGNAGLNGIGPVLGGSGARHVRGRDDYKSFDPRSRAGFL